MRKALVIGMGVSGRSAKAFLERRGYLVTAVDRKPSEGVLSDQAALDLSCFDLTVLSPGIPTTHPLAANAKELVGEVELALRSYTGPIIGITGTNGKSTVTLLVAHILNSAGIDAVACGNLGEPLTSVVDSVEEPVLVAELSSFQLETLSSQQLDAATILNISPDHLDRYESIEAYAAAKWRIRDALKEGAPLFVPPSLYREGCQTFGCAEPADFRAGEKELFLGEKIETFLPLQYRGKCHHHVHNWLAAYALCHHFEVTAEQFHAGYATFHRPAHRMELVRERKGVTWVNDSKGTNIDAVRVAVESVPGPIRLIAGGRDKGSPFEEWLPTFRHRVREVYAIGEAASHLEEALAPEIPVHNVGTMEQAVATLAKRAEAGEWVLLSPGCASFDQFPNFEKRGDCFKDLVEALT